MEKDFQLNLNGDKIEFQAANNKGFVYLRPETQHKSPVARNLRQREASNQKFQKILLRDDLKSY